MSTPLRRRALAALVALATVVVGAVATQPAGAATAAAVTFSKAKLTTGTDLDNVQRGQYRWLGAAPSPSTWPARDIYYRDQVYWGRLERTKGAYDFTWVEDGLRRAGETRGKFGFRVMAYCPGCWMESRTDKAAFPPVTPGFLPRQPGTTIPDWNSEAFLSSWEKLMAALGAKYGNDKRLGSVDIGGYGKYGEWWVDYGTQKITDANALRLVAAVNKAFPTKTVLYNTMTSVDLTLKALATNPRMGLRTDSLGARNMNSMLAVDTRLQSVWKTRPIYTEWATNGEPVLGRDQVKGFHLSTVSSGNMRLGYDAMTATQKSAYHDAIRSSGYRYYVSKVTVGKLLRGRQTAVTTTVSNLGVAPTYDGWSTQLWLYDSSGRRVLAKALSVDLRKVLPGTKTVSSDVAVPTTLPRGTYTASIAVVDRLGYAGTMYLANGLRRGDGSYTLGSVVVG
jgi:Domain of unknown function (DUF4832)